MIKTLTLVCSFWGLPGDEMNKEIDANIFSKIKLLSVYDSIDTEFKLISGNGTPSSLKSKFFEYNTFIKKNYVPHPKWIKSYKLESLYSDLEKITTPTMIISGPCDIVLPNEIHKVLHNKIPQSKFVEIKNSGHYPFITHHEEFNKCLLSFISME